MFSPSEQKIIFFHDRKKYSSLIAHTRAHTYTYIKKSPFSAFHRHGSRIGIVKLIINPYKEVMGFRDNVDEERGRCGASSPFKTNTLKERIGILFFLCVYLLAYFFKSPEEVVFSPPPHFLFILFSRFLSVYNLSS